MSSEQESIKSNYAENLNPADYAEYAAKVVADGPNMLRFELGFLYEVLKSDGDVCHKSCCTGISNTVALKIGCISPSCYSMFSMISFMATTTSHTTGRFQGTSLLEIGSSVLVHSVANASAYYPRIVMSDYVEESCKELKKWLAGEATIQQFLDVPAELEGYGSQMETGKKILEDRIRKCVKQVVRCDVMEDGIILEQLDGDLRPPYDLIIQAYCAECVAIDLDSLINIYKRINELLRPGGGIYASGFLRGKPWKVKNTEYHYLDITKDDLLRVLERAGFGNVELKTQERLSIDFDYEELFCVAAEKIEK